MSQQTVVLCPGQGAQRPGMAGAWCAASPAAKAVMDAADEILGDRLGTPLSELCLEGPAERLDRTDVSQPAILAAGVACWAGIGEQDGEADLAAAGGLSLGEYTALHLAGALSFEDALRTVAERGRLMQEAAEATAGGMVALVGADEDQAREVCDLAALGDEVVVPANFNAPGQIVLSGAAPACERAMGIASDRGLRAKALAVAGAFHSPLMQSAADALADVLAEVEIREPSVPVLSNVTGEAHDPKDPELLRRRLVEQVTSPVRWAQGCETLPAGDTIAYCELAPAGVLAGLMRRIDRTRKVQNRDEP